MKERIKKDKKERIMKSQKLQLYAALFGISLIFLSASLANGRFLLSAFPSAYSFSHPRDNSALPKTRGLTYVQKTENKNTIVTNEITTTYDTITIQGIPCEIIYNMEWTYVKGLNRKFLTAETYNFYAWDNKGNVWDFGKDSLKYLYNRSWRRSGINMKGSWLAGKNGALPRIIVPANAESR